MLELALPPLEPAELLARKDRFLADVRLADGEVREVYVGNPGRMEGQVIPGSRVWLRGGCGVRWYRLELIEIAGVLVGAFPAAAQELVASLLAQAPGERDSAEALEHFHGAAHAEVALGRCRIDFALSYLQGRQHFVEVKMTALVCDDYAYWPDSITRRGQRQLAELSAAVAEGRRATMLVVVLRAGTFRALRVSDVHDAAFAAAVRQAAAAGVEFRAWEVECSVEAYRWRREIPVILDEYDCSGVRAAAERNPPFSGWMRTFRPGPWTHVADAPSAKRARTQTQLGWPESKRPARGKRAVGAEGEKDRIEDARGIFCDMEYKTH